MATREDAFQDLFARLDRERDAADRAYNAALTAVDRAFATAPELPPPRSTIDPSVVRDLNGAWQILPETGPGIDRSLRGRLRGFIWRFVAPMLQSQQRFNALVVDHVNRNAAAAEDADRAARAVVDALRGELAAIARFQSLLLQFLQTITAYVDTKDRSAGGEELREQIRLMQQRLIAVERDLARRVNAGESSTAPAAASRAASSSATAADDSKYVGFEDRFRGATGDIRRRLEVYLPLFAGASDVLDVGCGRGELLELFRDAGIRARGIDVNQSMIDVCVQHGLDAACADALAYLDAQPDGSLGGLIAIQVVEHFQPPYLLRVLDGAFQKLRPGAALVLETVNVASWMAYFECYLRDLTHARPLHPDTLRYVVQAAGFTAVNVEFRQPVTPGDRLDRIEAAPSADPALAQLVAAVNAHADKLNARLFAPMDYAVVARR